MKLRYKCLDFEYIKGNLYLIPALNEQRITCVARNLIDYVSGNAIDNSPVRLAPIADRAESLTGLKDFEARKFILAAIDQLKIKLHHGGKL